MDRIHVLESGQMVESGSHEELLARGGVYAGLYRLQYQAESPEVLGGLPVRQF
jgi:ABC-type multidrug transport system fused ATPase/permease subunit